MSYCDGPYPTPLEPQGPPNWFILQWPESEIHLSLPSWLHATSHGGRWEGVGGVSKRWNCSPMTGPASVLPPVVTSYQTGISIATTMW